MSRVVNTYDSKPPPGYVPGKGRGATGFVTRSDVGSATAPASKPEPGEKRGQYDDDETDQDADAIYAAIDDRVKAKRRRKKEGGGGPASGADPANPGGGKISDAFSELKAKLGGVSEAEWAALPDVGERGKARPRQQETFTPVLDTVVAGAAKRLKGETDRSVDAGGGGDVSSVVGSLSSARQGLISQTLGGIADSVGGQSVVDPKGYLTSLGSQQLTSASDLGDIKKARLLLSSVCKTNPRHGPGWIAAARVEEFAGDMTAARNIIREGCSTCPEAEDVWLEAVRLSEPAVARSIVAAAIKKIPKSVRLYQAAAELEATVKGKRTVLRLALEALPSSVKLWKSAVALESVEDARVMLGRAVECVPHAADIWLALARLETYENARRVLNSARKALPAEVQVWIAAARLEEGQGNDGNVDRVVEKAVQSLGGGGVVKREQWLKEAEACEGAGSVATGAAIVRHAVGLGVDDEDRHRTFVADAEAALGRGSVATARAVFKHSLTLFPGKRNLWMKLAELERGGGTPATLMATLRDAVAAVPKAEVMWLM
ncbi:hypothetical protein TeGR_g5012 [Tetraparma gracilis]|uniref:PRP1 splicing factor N-terminal domain-containing protein n=1 Tax=Tetraparma gracilis TaxID=2962635 RepID=A0ABQ6N331_9STRA|nr:hypothetical protein TeGR_g5012 [Tetraparma gracilis]